MFLENDKDALAAYLSGDRSSDLVRPYFERHGLGHLLDKKEIGGRQL
jgi:hypothetical protein